MQPGAFVDAERENIVATVAAAVAAAGDDRELLDAAWELAARVVAGEPVAPREPAPLVSR